ncbi:MAG: iron ABC transporter permease [Desulfarculaceae bacterium]
MNTTAATHNQAIQAYLGQARKRASIIAVLFTLLAVSLIIGARHGAYPLDLWQMFAAFRGESGIAGDILWKLRLPRITMAMLVGCGLGFSGAICQAVLHNPLASPFTLGVASGAGFGAVLVIVLVGALGQEVVAASAFFFALITSLLVLAISRLKNASSGTLVLAGVAVMFLFSSLSSLLQYSGTKDQLQEIVFWFFGSLSKVGWNHIALTAAMVFLPLPLLMRWSWDLNLIMSGDEAAITLGVNVKRLRLSCIVIASLMTAGSICFTGVIGFIGLVAPHITRMVLGSDHRYLLPGSAVVGALLVVNADTLGRMVWSPQIIPIGIVTSFVGVPFFLYLLLRKSREYW